MTMLAKPMSVNLKVDTNFPSVNEDGKESSVNSDIQQPALSLGTRARQPKPKATTPTLRRARLTSDQHAVLENAFLIDPNWSKRYVKELALSLNLNRVKVYKWHWDRKKKELQERNQDADQT